ncbi:unnamed protein product [Chironomus riparius]|uniref:Uncharacterized protein n=1 Tax=Chironomus riparius TaxID=315576 RepID=A0A9P0J5A9_9DIPT|nr:unnamed protein product [Chironomus riparius]
MDQKRTVLVGILVICILLPCAFTKPQINSNIPTCGSRTSCKWLYYGTDTLGKRYTKQIIVNNKCTCLPSQSCVYDEENISLDLMVYRCRDDPTPPISKPEKPSNQSST